MKRLHRYILKSFLGPLVLTFFIVMFLMIMQFLWRYIDDLVGKGLHFNVLAELLFYLAASFVPMALPLAILLAALMTFGNFGERFELTAMKSSGIPLQKIMLPVFYLMIALTVFAFYFANNILPIANLKSRSLLWDIQRQRPELNIKAGEFYNGIDGYSIKIGKKDFQTNMLYHILIYDHSAKKGNISVTYADSGKMIITPNKEDLIFNLYHGQSYEEIINNGKRPVYRKNKTYPFRQDYFSEQILVIKLTGFGLKRTDENLFKNNYSMLNLSQLQHFIDSLNRQLDSRKIMFKTTIKKQCFKYAYTFSKYYKSDSLSKNTQPDSLTAARFDIWQAISKLSKPEQQNVIDEGVTDATISYDYIRSVQRVIEAQIKWIRRHQIEWHRKFTLSIACVIFFFIGAPLGAIIRKGGLGMPITISVVFFVFYYIISMSGEKFVREDVWSPFSGMWISTFILLPIGIYLTYKSTNDAAIMSPDAYSHFFRRLTDRILHFLSSKKKD
ncbi:MAG: LptF/LptG family permease [Bacteroidales bacterium]|nr:LptF/LptG family permease [Bacteroidales bacterium]